MSYLKKKMFPWFKCMISLAFVSLDEIENVYMHLVDEAEDLFNDDVYAKVNKCLLNIFLTIGFPTVQLDQ